jgi:hypothetical protein
MVVMQARPRVIPLHNGANAIDLLGNGSRGQVMVARRANYNAHGHSDVAFSIYAKSDLGERAIWQVVPFFGSEHDSKLVRDLFGTTEGADCTLADLRVVKHEGAPVEVVIARRDMKRSYADAEAVHFDYYALRHNADQVPGWPSYYFQYTRTQTAQHPYCDVNDAFATELRMSPRGVAGPIISR